MLQKGLFCLFLTIFAHIVQGQTLYLRLDEVIDIAQSNSISSKRNKNTKNILNINANLNRANYLPKLNWSLSAPNYNRSISPITQPDGTTEFIEIRNSTPNSSLNLQYPIVWTGANFSINSSTSTNNLFNLGTESNSVTSLTFYRLNISQPLSFFSSAKWDRRIFKLQQIEEEKNIRREDYDIKQKAIELFFNLFINQERHKLAKEFRNYTQLVLNRTKEKFKQKLVSKTEMLKAQINLRDSQISFKNSQNQLKISSIELLLFLNLDKNLDLVLFSPHKTVFELENVSDLMKRVQHSNIQNKRKLLELKSTKNIKKHKSALYGDGSINLSAGLNSSGNNYTQILDNKSQQQSISLSLNIPLINWKTAKSRLQIARIKAESEKIDLEENWKNLQVKIHKLYSMLETGVHNFNSQLNTIKLKEELRMEYRILLDYNKIDILKYNIIEKEFVGKPSA